MNIFIMILLAVLMMGYYVISSPSNSIPSHETDSAIATADMHSIAECAVAVHNAQIMSQDFDDICIEQNQVQTAFVCLNNNLSITDCIVKNKRKPAYSFIITVTAPLSYDKYNDMLDILEKYYADSGTFGIFQDGAIVSGGTSNKRVIPSNIVSNMSLQNGQLVYLTQYEIPDTEQEFTTLEEQDISCPSGTSKIYRFGRWQCVSINTKTDCTGDMIWDTDLSECVPDETRRPLCSSNQNAVIVDSVWECIDPFSDKTCPSNMVARLNYSTLEWECVQNPDQTSDTKKCDHITQGAIYGKPGATLRIPPVSCTDCEKMVINENTCESVCVPDVTKINNTACYPGKVSECRGASRAFYFGFPSTGYAQNIPELKNALIILDAQHTQNRKFNCLDCGDRNINTSVSVPPYTAICE